MSITVSQIVRDGTYRIRSALKEGRYLEYLSGRGDVRPMPSDPSSDLQKWIIKGNPQDINTYTITTLVSNTPLSASEDTNDAGEPIWRVRAPGMAERSWTLEPRAKDQFVIGFAENELCVDFADFGKSDWCILWPRKNAPNQRWVLEPADSSSSSSADTSTGTAPTPTPTSALAGLDLTKSGGSIDNVPVIGYAAHGGTNQQWRLIRLPEPSDGGANALSLRAVWTLQNVESGTYLDLLNGDSSPGAKVVGWAGSTADGNTNQLWYLVPTSGVFGLQNVGTGTYVSLPDKADRTPVVASPGTAWGAPASEEQRWTLARV